MHRLIVDVNFEENSLRAREEILYRSNKKRSRWLGAHLVPEDTQAGAQARSPLYAFAFWIAPSDSDGI